MAIDELFFIGAQMVLGKNEKRVDSMGHNGNDDQVKRSVNNINQ